MTHMHDFLLVYTLHSFNHFACLCGATKLEGAESVLSPVVYEPNDSARTAQWAQSYRFAGDTVFALDADGVWWRNTRYGGEKQPAFWDLDKDGGASGEQIAPDAISEVKCQCGSTSFHISFSEYECLATCASCGAKECVYDG